MIEIVNWIIEFIKDKITNDSDFNGIEFHIQLGYDKNNDYPFPQIIIANINDREHTRATTFQGEQANLIGLQIMNFSEILTINGVDYTPHEATLFIANKIKRWFQELKGNRINRNMLSVRRVGSTMSMPIDSDGIVYVGINRFENIVVNDYIE